jgi:very-short-patch-repair endonuclease
MMTSFAGEGWGEGMEKSVLRQRARNLRQNSTDAEKHLWYYLRANRLGCKFKRQVPMGSYIVDFVCHEKRVIIELDGGQHAENQMYDMNRTAWLTERGFKVLRFWNHDVFQQTPSVMEVIVTALL